MIRSTRHGDRLGAELVAPPYRPCSGDETATQEFLKDTIRNGIQLIKQLLKQVKKITKTVNCSLNKVSLYSAVSEFANFINVLGIFITTVEVVCSKDHFMFVVL